MPKVSAILITKNEADRVAAALDSIRWADELIVVDSGSDDGTVEIATRYTDRVIQRAWPGFVEQKNHAASLATYDWILSLDADERVTPALEREIRATLAAEPAARGYRIPRCSFYLGAWIRSTDWYPDYQLRLYDRRVARWTGRHVHESVSVDGTVRTLAADLQHHPYRDVSDHVARMNAYTALAARQMHEDGRRAGALDLVTHPAAAFVRNYVLKGGIRQGGVGLAVSSLNSYYVFLKFMKLYELQRERRERG